MNKFLSTQNSLNIIDCELYSGNLNTRLVWYSTGVHFIKLKQQFWRFKHQKWAFKTLLILAFKMPILVINMLHFGVLNAKSVL